MIKFIKSLTRRFGVDIVRYYPPLSVIPSDLGEEARKLILRVRPFTMTSSERIFALSQAVRYIAEAQIPGDIVECGVWKGGSMMAVAYTLLSLGDDSRDLYLFDTFEGMPPPSKADVSVNNESASALLALAKKEDAASVWCYASLEEVKEAIYSTGYPGQKIHLVKGLVEETIPNHAPETISLLRLDTDWYESTRHELAHLFPRISQGGVIIVDDYGHWQGARQAVDEYIKTYNIPILLNRVDYSARIGIVLKNE